MAFMRVFGAKLVDTLAKSTPISRARPRPATTVSGALSPLPLAARVSVCYHLSLARVAGSRGDSRGGRRGESAERETTHSTHSARRPAGCQASSCRRRVVSETPTPRRAQQSKNIPTVH